MRVNPILLIILVMAAIPACEGTNTTTEVIPNEVPDRVRYVALGDSLATGAGADTSYVTEYATWLENETSVRVAVTNLAVDGWTSGELLAALREDQRMRSAVSEAHVVTWDIGGNDLLTALSSFLQGTCGGSDGRACIREALDEAARNGDAILDELLELRDGEAAGVRTLDLYLPFVNNSIVAPYIDELRPYLDQFNESLTDRSRERGVPVANVHRAFHGPDGTEDPVAVGRIAEDGIHPSDRGHEVIAAELAALGLELGRLGRDDY